MNYIKKIRFDYAQRNDNAVNEAARKAKITLSKKIKREVSIDFDKGVNLIYSPIQNKLGKSIILHSIKYVLYDKGSQVNHLIEISNKLLSGREEQTIPGFDDGLFVFNYDVTLEFYDGTLLKREINNKDGRFSKGRWFISKGGDFTQLKDKDYLNRLSDIYPNWPMAIGMNKIIKSNTIAECKYKVFSKNSDILTPSWFLSNFDFMQNDDEAKSTFFRKLKEKGTASTNYSKKSAIYSMSSDPQEDLRNTFFRTIKQLETLTSNIEKIDFDISRIKIASKNIDKEKVVDLDDLIANVKGKVSELDYLIESYGPELKIFSMEKNNSGMIDPTLKLAKWEVEIKFNELNNLLKKIDNARNYVILNSIDNEKIIEDLNEEIKGSQEIFNKLIDSLVENFSIIEKFSENRVNDETLFNFLTDNQIGGGAINIERNMERLSKYVKSDYLMKGIPFLMIDNIASEKDNDWELICDPLHEISSTSTFNQIFVTLSKKGPLEYIHKNKLIEINKNIFIND